MKLDGQKHGNYFLNIFKTGNVCFIGLPGPMPKRNENDSFHNKLNKFHGETRSIPELVNIFKTLFKANL